MANAHSCWASTRICQTMLFIVVFLVPDPILGEDTFSEEMYRSFQSGALKYYNYDIQENKLEPFDEESLQPGKPLKIIIHGWNPSLVTAITEVLNLQKIDLILKEYSNQLDVDHTVIVIDWLNWATTSPLGYLKAVNANWEVGEETAKYLVALKTSGKIANLSDVHIIGHSLGAHQAGVIGYFVKELSNEMIGRITGLDPAGPLYDELLFSGYFDYTKSLDKEDAEFVDIIHTNAKGLGSNVQAGHADFYPNGGAQQVQCGGILRLGGVCAHQYSVIYYAMAMRQPDAFISCSCDSYGAYTSGECSCDQESGVILGEFASNSARGKYFLSVSARSIEDLTSSDETETGNIHSEGEGQNDLLDVVEKLIGGGSAVVDEMSNQMGNLIDVFG